MATIDVGQVVGKSAYQIALDHGFVGTEEEWLDSLKVGGITIRINEQNHTVRNGKVDLGNISGEIINAVKKLIPVIDENGILTNTDGKQYLLVPYVPAPTVISTEYDTPVIKITYLQIREDGGTVSPVLTYTQRKTYHYSDGSTVDTTITTGASVSYEGAAANGQVTASANESTEVKDVATVTVTVSLNGKTASKTVTVKQAGKIERKTYYVGYLSATKSGFTTLSQDDIKAKAEFKSITATSTLSYVAKENCFFLLVPEAITFDSCYYISGGLRTDLAPSDFNLVHEDLLIDGISYKVYGYRFNGISESNPLTYNYKLIV